VADEQRRRRLDPATAAIRLRVREAVGKFGLAHPLVAVSGGADSMSLAAAVQFLARTGALHASYAVIDHGLQAQSAEVTALVVERLRAGGCAEVVSRRVRVGSRGGREAAAREARYAGLRALRSELGCDAILVAHTRDDQAETVLLNLSRGAGAAGLSGLHVRRGEVIRPLLAVSRAQTVASCAAQGIPVWHDPMNDDPAFTRVRIRTRVLPMLERELGPGYAASLARAAGHLAADERYLAERAAEAASELIDRGSEGLSLPVAPLLELPEAIRHRVLRLAMEELGGAPRSAHIDALDALLAPGRGGRRISLPGAVALREGGTMRLLRRSHP
jgi:tRNA(Ile)-lysidine synthase